MSGEECLDEPMRVGTILGFFVPQHTQPHLLGRQDNFVIDEFLLSKQTVRVNVSSGLVH